MRFLKTLLILLSLFLSFSAQTQSIELDMSEELNLRLKLLTTMAQFQKRLESEFEGQRDFVEQLETDNAFRENFETRYSQLVKGYWEDEVSHLPLPSQLKKNILERIALIPWNHFAKKVSSLFSGIKSFARVHGAAQALVYVANTTFQFTIPPLLIAHGQPLLAAILFYASGDIPVFLTHTFIKRSYIKFKLKSLLGGAEEYGRYENALNAAKKELNLTSILGDVMIPLNSKEALVLEAADPVQKILKRFGFREGKVSLRRFQKFIKDENISDPIIEKVLASRYSEQVKFSLIAPRLMDVMNSESEGRFRVLFNASLTELPQLNYGSELEEWLLRVVQSHTWSQAQEQLQLVPKNIKPMEMVMIWEHVLLPYFAKRSDLLGYREFRHLSRSFTKVKAQTFLNRNSASFDFYPNIWKSYLGLKSCNLSLGQVTAKEL